MIPDYEGVMLPLLRLLGDRKEHSLGDSVEALGQTFGLTSDELAELLPSGGQPLFYNRVGWARTYLKKAGLVESTRRGYFKITSRGLDVLCDNPVAIDCKYLERFPEFVQFRSLRRAKPDVAPPPVAVGSDGGSRLTPEEALQLAHQEIIDTLAQDLLAKVKDCSPSFFERLVVRLLVKMGYGGSEDDVLQAVGASGDEGIDGVIKEDALGLDVVYVQAKRWESTVGRPLVNAFVGALIGQHARKGVFITTSRFSSDAVAYAKNVDPKVVLVDGEALARLMIQYGVGVATAQVYEIRRIDSDYFVEE